MTILITGALGYIGSHITVELLNQNYDVVLIDNVSNSKTDVIERLEKLTGKDIKFYKIDLLSQNNLKEVFRENNIQGVIHLAGSKSVEESITDPLKYYENNVIGLLNLSIIMKEYNIKNFVFSSSATVYGIDNKSPMTEDMNLSTINPYGTTKLMCEQILKDLYISDNSWSINILRYFNPIGSHKSGMIGEDPSDIPTNIMPIINKVAMKEMDKIYVFGNDYDTFDGTCIRDYIHVVDLAKGHIKAIEKNMVESGLFIYNLGTGRGYSVLELINTFERVTGVTIDYEFTERRQGDIDICYANPNKAFKELGWKAEFGIEEMCMDSWRWKKNSKLI